MKVPAHFLEMSFVMLLAMMQTAAAQSSYSATAEKLEKCKVDGAYASAFFDAPKDFILKAFADIDADVAKKKLTKKKGSDGKFLIYQGMSAPSEEAAYRRGWAACMDNKYDFK